MHFQGKEPADLADSYIDASEERMHKRGSKSTKKRFDGGVTAEKKIKFEEREGISKLQYNLMK